MKFEAIADTSFVLALANDRDLHHERARTVYDATSAILLPQVVLVELAYLVDRAVGNRAAIKVLEDLLSSKFELRPINLNEYKRAIALLRKYADSHLDFVDAIIVAVAESENIARVLTFDRRDFGLIRPAHRKSFELIEY